MKRWRSVNNRRARRKYWQPVACPRHGLAYRGGGWVLAGGYRFALFECPRSTCRNFKLVNDGAPGLSEADLALF